MGICKTIDREIIDICLSDLRYRIVLVSKVMTAGNGSSVDFTEAFTDVATVWALAKPAKAVRSWDSVTLSDDETATHEFYIRYRTDITSENMIRYDSKYFDIIDVKDIDLNKNWLLLAARETGATSKTASQVGTRP